jgi:hypothetical protein
MDCNHVAPDCGAELHSVLEQPYELIFRAFSYNSWRLEALSLSLIEGFYRATLSLAVDLD